jgi:Ca-activated chloride channel family protein
MNEDGPQFALSCKDGNAPAPVLLGVQAQGRLDAVLFELTLRQTYRNTSSQVLEVVYTFPLPPMAVLLGFASELNGERQEGVIVAKREAERQYEESLEQGDAAVMLEAHDDGLHTANIGNLKPGDELVLECRFAQLLNFEQGRLRVSIPTTIAPRYGRAEQAGLQPQQVPLASLDAEYPLALTVTLGEALAGATAECPTHRFATSLGQDGSMRMALSQGARLDRDIVVIVTPREPRPSLLVRADNAFDASAPVVMMAALQPPMGAPRERIALKLLVDCSGSMNGDSIASARAALRGVVAGLSDRDLDFGGHRPKWLRAECIADGRPRQGRVLHQHGQGERSAQQGGVPRAARSEERDRTGIRGAAGLAGTAQSHRMPHLRGPAGWLEDAGAGLGGPARPHAQRDGAAGGCAEGAGPGPARLTPHRQ